MTLSLKSVSKIAVLASGFALLGTGCVADGESTGPNFDPTVQGEFAPTESEVPPVISTDPTHTVAPTPVVVARKQANPSNLVLAGDSLYWVEFSANRVFLKWQSVVGGENLIGTQLDSLPFSMVADASGLYLAASSEQNIVFAPHLGLQPRPLYSSTTDPLALAVDGDFAYWTAADGCLYRGAVEGGSSATLGCADSAGTTLALADGMAYMTTVDGGLYRAELTPGGSFNLLLKDQNFGDGLVVDTSGVSWVDSVGRQVLRYDSLSESVRVLADNQFAPASIAQDRFFIYFSTQGDGSVKRVPKRGGRVAVLATQQDQPGQLAVGSDIVYWINEGNGAIMSQTTRFNF